MGMKMGSGEERPTINNPALYDALRNGRKLLQHPELPTAVVVRLMTGLQHAQLYVDDPHNCPAAVITGTKAFLRDFKLRARLCHQEESGGLMDAVKALHILLAQNQRPRLPEGSVFTLKDLQDYGDTVGRVDELLRCKFCFSQSYHNQIDPRTGAQWQWADIAQMLTLQPTIHLLSARQLCNDERTAMVSKLAKSIHEAGEATDLQESVRSRIMGYLDQDAPIGPKELLRTGDWAGLARHTHEARNALYRLWRGPRQSDSLAPRAAWRLLAVVALVQFTWFESIWDEGRSFNLRDAAVEYRDRLREAGGNPQSLTGPRANLIDIELLQMEHGSELYAIDKDALNPLRRTRPDHNARSSEDLASASVDDDAQSETSEASDGTSDVSTIVLDPIELYPPSLDDYGLPETHRINPQRVRILSNLYDDLERAKQQFDQAVGSSTIIEDGRPIILELRVRDLDDTLLSAIRSPSLYDDSFLERIKHDTGAAATDLAFYGLARFPGRGLVDSSTLNGLFHQTNIAQDDPDRELDIRRHYSTVRTGIERQEYDSVRQYLDGEDIDAAMVLTRNARAARFLRAMREMCTSVDDANLQVALAEDAVLAMERGDIADSAETEAAAFAHEQERRFRLRWIDLLNALRRATHPIDSFLYSDEVCAAIIDMAGSDELLLRERGLRRIQTIGLEHIDDIQEDDTEMSG